MKRLVALLGVLLAQTSAGSGLRAQAPPSDWIDPATGHRILRLSGDDGGSSLYFHQNTYTPKGDKLVFDTRAGIAAVDLSNHDYGLEPNVTITPDNKWVVFRSNMHGRTHVYAVEIARSR
jgi:hypothetical protein